MDVAWLDFQSEIHSFGVEILNLLRSLQYCLLELSRRSSFWSSNGNSDYASMFLVYGITFAFFAFVFANDPCVGSMREAKLNHRAHIFFHLDTA